MALKKLVGKRTKNRSNPSGVTSVKVGDKVVNTLEPVDLTHAEVKFLEEKGYVLTNGTKEEVELLEEIRKLSPVVGTDVVAAGPVFGHRAKAQKSTKEVS